MNLTTENPLCTLLYEKSFEAGGNDQNKMIDLGSIRKEVLTSSTPHSPPYPFNGIHSLCSLFFGASDFFPSGFAVPLCNLISHCNFLHFKWGWHKEITGFPIETVLVHWKHAVHRSTKKKALHSPKVVMIPCCCFKHSTLRVSFLSAKCSISLHPLRYNIPASKRNPSIPQS